MSGYITPLSQKILSARSGGRCAFPGCQQLLIKDGNKVSKDAFFGEMAHIKGEKPGAARYDPNMTDAERNHHKNLILLCRNHHSIVDKQPEIYTVEVLYSMKDNHEKWIDERCTPEVQNITFAELEVVTKYLISNTVGLNSDWKAISPSEKIAKNNLSARIENLIKMGMSRVTLVKRYIDNNLDIEYGERLKQGFVEEYKRLYNDEGLRGDELFDSMHSFASAGSTEFAEKAAGLVVLVYFFDICEVFEK